MEQLSNLKLEPRSFLLKSEVIDVSGSEDEEYGHEELEDDGGQDDEADGSRVHLLVHLRRLVHIELKFEFLKFCGAIGIFPNGLMHVGFNVGSTNSQNQKW
jgi:hypothetical protein